MRRMLLMTVASSALLLALPAGTSAHHHAHKARHHARHHIRHHSRIRHFGTLANTKSVAGTNTSSPVTPAGTVASFTEGVLTITLADKSTVSGKVTDDTELRCVTEGAGDDDDFGEHHAFAADHGSSDDQGEDNDDQD